MLQLATDATLRDSLGAAARRYWEAHHTVDRMVDDYERALARAASLPPPTAALPGHLRPDPLAHARSIANPIAGGLKPAPPAASSGAGGDGLSRPAILGDLDLR
jgi:hypothetical protein